jgi:hypothetical protein
MSACTSRRVALAMVTFSIIRMSALGQKRTFCYVRAASALPLESDIDWRLVNVRQALKRLNLKLIYVNNSLSKL